MKRIGHRKRNRKKKKKKKKWRGIKKGQGKMERKMNNEPQKRYTWSKRKRGKINPK